jgi:transglutaminase-like putative cysteine protease
MPLAVTVRQLSEEQRKWAFLADVPKVDAKTPECIELARRIGTVASLTPTADWCFANLALALVRDCIAYQLDNERVGREQIDGYTGPYVSPLLPLARGVDDCDAKARLFVALCLARGLEAEMVPRWKGSRLSHVYARVRLRGRGDVNPRWWFAETILRRARLGDVAENVPKELETGKWSF